MGNKNITKKEGIKMNNSFDLEKLLNDNLEKSNEKIKDILNKFNSLYGTNITFTTHNVVPPKINDLTFNMILTLNDDNKFTKVTFRYSYNTSRCTLMEQLFVNRTHEEIYFILKCLFGFIIMSDQPYGSEFNAVKAFDKMEEIMSKFFRIDMMSFVKLSFKSFKENVLGQDDGEINTLNATSPLRKESNMPRKKIIYQLFSSKEMLETADLIAVYFLDHKPDPEDRYLIIKIRDKALPIPTIISKDDIIDTKLFNKIIGLYRKPIIIDSSHIDIENDPLISEKSISTLKEIGGLL